ncbi:hypothetical protein ANN_26060 [Periplaneta americana]|uniref:Uncharacterized protein n=1 Tax=Periplaneta americana TaxID=6978 RepID=A0ABQ8S596_PERAM|nr:hypothetical protein ANN_26060 [Periplaneta americana]
MSGSSTAEAVDRSDSTVDTGVVCRRFRRQSNCKRLPQKTSVTRIMGFNRVQRDLFFNNLTELQRKYKFSPTHVYNMDETGITTVPVPNKAPKIVTTKGKRAVGKVSSAEWGQLVTAVCLDGNPGRVITQFQVAQLFGKPYLKNNATEKAVKMFEVCGIVPMDRLKFGEEDFLHSEVTGQRSIFPSASSGITKASNTCARTLAEEKKIKLLNESYMISIDADPFVLCIVTPIMQRNLKSVNIKESFYLDTSSSRDQSNSALAIVSVATKAVLFLWEFSFMKVKMKIIINPVCST